MVVCREQMDPRTPCMVVCRSRWTPGHHEDPCMVVCRTQGDAVRSTHGGQHSSQTPLWWPWGSAAPDPTLCVPTRGRRPPPRHTCSPCRGRGNRWVRATSPSMGLGVPKGLILTPPTHDHPAPLPHLHAPLWTRSLKAV